MEAAVHRASDARTEYNSCVCNTVDPNNSHSSNHNADPNSMCAMSFIGWSWIEKQTQNVTFECVAAPNYTTEINAKMHNAIRMRRMKLNIQSVKERDRQEERERSERERVWVNWTANSCTWIVYLSCIDAMRTHCNCVNGVSCRTMRPNNNEMQERNEVATK